MTLSPKQRSVLRLLSFLVGASIAFIAIGPVVGFLTTLFAIGPGHPAAVWIYPTLVSVSMLGLTWGALRIERQGLRALGLVLTRRRAAEFGVGFAVAASLFALVALARAASVGARWTFDPIAGTQAAAFGLPLALALLLPEELLFRGYAFQKAEMLWGAPATLVVSSLAFGAYHIIGSNDSAIAAVFLLATPALGGLAFGLALLRTGGLAMPIGLHLGGNWVNASVLGLAVPEGTALWRTSLTPEQLTILSAPSVLARLPYLIAMTVLVIVVMAWPRSRQDAV